MKKTPVLLIDDPQANDTYDLVGALSGWPHGMAGVVRALRADEATAATPSDASAPAPSVDADGDKSAESPTTTALKTRPVRYRISGKGVAERDFAAPEGASVLQALGKTPLVLVSFVSNATFPLVSALGEAESTRDFLQVGITGVRMDTNYNLAQKLLFDGVVSYHEHSLIVAKVLRGRLELMLNAHEERLWHKRKSS